MADSFVGEVQMFAGMYAPTGWASCDGQILSISEYPTLFNVIGTTYGGNGQTTFALPDLRGRVVIHAGTAGGPQYAVGQKGGNASVTLTTANLPPHSHAVRGSAISGTQASPINGLPAAGQSYAASTTATMAADAVASSGSGLPLSVQQPYVGVSYIISLNGTYPIQS